MVIEPIKSAANPTIIPIAIHMPVNSANIVQGRTDQAIPCMHIDS